MYNYNNGKPLSLDDINRNDFEVAATDFAEGSESLKQCLLSMWNNGLKSKACCKGYHDESTIFDPAYIAMEPNVDLFCYLSQEVIDSPYVSLSIMNDNTQIINIYGGKLDEICPKIVRDISTAPKRNTIVQKQISSDVLLESYIYALKNNGFTDDEIKDIYSELEEYAKLEEKRTYYKHYIIEYLHDQLNQELEKELDVFFAIWDSKHESMQNLIKTKITSKTSKI